MKFVCTSTFGPFTAGEEFAAVPEGWEGKNLFVPVAGDMPTPPKQDKPAPEPSTKGN